MNFRKTSVIIPILILAVGIAAFLGWQWYHSLRPVASTALPMVGIPATYHPIDVVSEANGSDSAEIEDLVVAFGAKLQTVPLAASPEIIRQAIVDNYSAYVSSALLDQWTLHPENAPGRKTSSPWPDHIEISRIGKNTDGTFTVTGTVVELTSNELAHGGVANSYPLNITVANTNHVWLITAVSK